MIADTQAFMNKNQTQND